MEIESGEIEREESVGESAGTTEYVQPAFIFREHKHTKPAVLLEP